jgi:predicted DNA binding protein
MSVIVEFTVPADQFALGDLLAVNGGVEVRLESFVPTRGGVIPFFWVANEHTEAVETALQNAPIVERVKRVDELESSTLFRVDWSPDVDGLVKAIVENEGIILEGVGLDDTWSFQIRFPDHDALSGFYHHSLEADLSLNLMTLHRSTQAANNDAAGLTPEQREALQVALEAGYFDVPRAVTLVELADRLDITDSAASQRIRRGLSTLLATVAFAETEELAVEEHLGGSFGGEDS